MKEKLINIEKGFTHSGKFHSDDVFATAFLEILNPDIKIERGFNIPENFQGIVYDIGKGKFDHHQMDAKIRENGCPYAAFGLIWKEFSGLIFDEEAANKFDEKFIQPLDLSDNTGCDNEIADLIAIFNPTWDSEASYDEAFRKAVIFAKAILENKFLLMISSKKAEAVIEEALLKAKNHILVLDKFAPFKSKIFETDILYVIYPSQRGGYSIQAVPSDEDKNILKLPFPENIRGLSKEEMVEITGISTLNFCHNSGFMAGTESFEDAMEICYYTMRLAKIDIL